MLEYPFNTGEAMSMNSNKLIMSIRTMISHIIYYLYKNIHRWLDSGDDHRVLPHQFQSTYGWIPPIEMWHRFGSSIIEEFLLHCKCCDIDNIYIDSSFVIRRCSLDIFKKFEIYLHDLLQLKLNMTIVELYTNLVDTFKAIVKNILKSYRFYIQEIF